ncbi:MAG: complex I subunit 5 family protein [Wenzhouxiangellaceae bacterium]|nr:complex I subunit 5 family protein [Wenzhouxiangellaceae bacterium]
MPTLETFHTGLLIVLLLLPLAAAAVIAIWPRFGAHINVFVTALTLLLALALLTIDGVVTAELPAMLGVLVLRADPAARLFVLAAALVWLAAAVYATRYFDHDPHARRFHTLLPLLLAANLGVFVAGDWLSLLVLFELLGFGGLLLVIHAGDEPARRATVKYFWMTLVGGVALLAGIALLAQVTGTLAFVAIPDTPTARLAVALMLAGFAVKAGLLGVHVWLPDAHTVAPAPGSALLSGVMIKAGAFGIYRCLAVLGAGTDSAVLVGDFASALLVIGLAGMLVGAIAALGQRHAKRLLAWSSISQMGFIIAALAAGALPGMAGSDAQAAGLLHAFNHALYKGALFLAVGAVMHAAGTADLDRLGGLARRMPLLFALTLIAVAGIIGLPPFNGFISKTLIHHALVELAALDARWAVAEWLYYAASIGTAAMFARLVYCMFGSSARPALKVEAVPRLMQLAIAIPAVLVLAVGLFPTIVLDALIAPAVSAELHWHPSIADRLSPFVIGLAGVGLAALAGNRGWLGWRLPDRLTVDGVYRRFGIALVAACTRIGWSADHARRSALRQAGRLLRWLQRGLATRWTDSARIVVRGRRLRLPHDRVYRHLDLQRDWIISRAQWLANRAEVDASGTFADPDHERLLDATHHYAGWLGTRLLNAGMQLEPDAGMRLAHARAGVERLAELALAMARIDVESGHDRCALERADETLEAMLGSHRETPVPPMPLRHALRELHSVVFHLVTDPIRRHWPVSENLAHGAFASAIRRHLHSLSRDPGAGIAMACFLMALLVLLIALAQ